MDQIQRQNRSRCLRAFSIAETTLAILTLTVISVYSWQFFMRNEIFQSKINERALMYRYFLLSDRLLKNSLQRVSPPFWLSYEKGMPQTQRENFVFFGLDDEAENSLIINKLQLVFNSDDISIKLPLPAQSIESLTNGVRVHFLVAETIITVDYFTAGVTIES